MTESKPKTPTFKEKLLAVMAAVGNIEKKGRNDFHKYDYVRDEDVQAAIRAEFVRHRLLISPSVQKQTLHVGDKGNLADIEMQVRIVDVDSTDELVIPWAGLGYDANDKSLYKAITGGLKYVLLKTFMISTGDDPEQDHGKHQATPKRTAAPAPAATSGQYGTLPITPKQKMGLAWRIKKAGRPEPKPEWLNSLTSVQASKLIEQLDAQIPVADPLAVAEDVFNTPDAQ